MLKRDPADRIGIGAVEITASVRGLYCMFMKIDVRAACLKFVDAAASSVAWKFSGPMPRMAS